MVPLTFVIAAIIKSATIAIFESVVVSRILASKQCHLE